MRCNIHLEVHNHTYLYSSILAIHKARLLSSMQTICLHDVFNLLYTMIKQRPSKILTAIFGVWLFKMTHHQQTTSEYRIMSREIFNLRRCLSYYGLGLINRRDKISGTYRSVPFMFIQLAEYFWLWTINVASYI